MLPIYISYFAAGEPDKRRALRGSVGFVTGFTAVFALLGAFAGAVGMLLRQYVVLLNIVTGAIVVVFGLNFLGVLKIGLLNRAYRLDGLKPRTPRPPRDTAGEPPYPEQNNSSDAARTNTDPKIRGVFSSVLFGVVFSVGWTPCVGAFLGSALMLASQQGSAPRGILMLLTFSLGLGIPFIISAVLIDRLKGAFDFIRRNYGIVNTVSGGFLVIIGLLMMSGYMGSFLSLLG